MITENCGFWERAKDKSFDALVCTTNNVIKYNGALVMGAGIARQFSEEFKGIDSLWGQIVEGLQEGGHEDYHLIVDGPRKRFHSLPIYLVGLQTKRDWADPSPIELVTESCKKLKDLADILNWSKILMTPPGCGNGGLNWKDVQKSIKFLDDRFLVVDNKIL